MNEVLEHLPPVTPSPQEHATSQTTGPPLSGIGLCMSGGGYRAMLFHLGALWRLNELGYLPKLDIISSVSGGSIMAGQLGLKWSSLTFSPTGVADNFNNLIVEPIRNFAGITVDVWAVLGGAFGPGSVGERVAKAYSQYLFGTSSLQDLPDRPLFVINATNVQSGVLWRFSKPYMGDYRVGEVKAPTVELAVAVAASSAFPPVLSPLHLKLDAAAFTPASGMDLQMEPYTTNVELTDGGVYDNLGLERVWKKVATVLVSDGGGRKASDPKPKRDWPRHAVRVLNIIDSQVRSLRKRQLIDSFTQGQRKGTFWGLNTNIADYQLDTALDCPFEKTLLIAAVPTRLGRIDSVVQEKLINWGYAVSDAGMRRHVDPNLPTPAGFPYPKVGVG